jgi:hypothetical protein
LSIIKLDQLVAKLPIAEVSPTRSRLHCLQSYSAGGIDQLDWAVFQENDTEQIWINVRGGIAGIDIWYGPADRNALVKIDDVLR